MTAQSYCAFIEARPPRSFVAPRRSFTADTHTYIIPTPGTSIIVPLVFLLSIKLVSKKNTFIINQAARWLKQKKMSF